MRRQYLHVSAYSCDRCQGPVISGSTAVRENEISKETEITQIGAICLSCGYRQDTAGVSGGTHDFPPIQWNSPIAVEPEHLISACVEQVNREELH